VASQKQELDEFVTRFKKKPVVLRVVYGRPRTFAAIAIGIAAGFLLPGSLRPVTRFIVGWDVFAALYLVLAYIMMLRCDVAHIRRSAILQDDGRFLILLVTAFGALASLGAIVYELGASKGNPAGLILAIATIVLSWTLVHTVFALRYAHEYYTAPVGGIDFKNDDEKPDYHDFAYVAFTVGMTFQVADTDIQSQAIRRTVLQHALLSYLFGAVILAVTVNVIANVLF